MTQWFHVDLEEYSDENGVGDRVGERLSSAHEPPQRDENMDTEEYGNSFSSIHGSSLQPPERRTSSTPHISDSPVLSVQSPTREYFDSDEHESEEGSNVVRQG